jgi:hypothetical protein
VATSYLSSSIAFTIKVRCSSSSITRILCTPIIPPIYYCYDITGLIAVKERQASKIMIGQNKNKKHLSKMTGNTNNDFPTKMCSFEIYSKVRIGV